MVQIKVLKFPVTNFAYGMVGRDERDIRRFADANAKLATPEHIQKTVNDFCKEHNVRDIQVTSVDVDYHNNGYHNMIELYYTIIYEA